MQEAHQLLSLLIREHVVVTTLHRQIHPVELQLSPLLPVELPLNGGEDDRKEDALLRDHGIIQTN